MCEPGLRRRRRDREQSPRPIPMAERWTRPLNHQSDAHSTVSVENNLISEIFLSRGGREISGRRGAPSRQQGALATGGLLPALAVLPLIVARELQQRRGICREIH